MLMKMLLRTQKRLPFLLRKGSLFLCIAITLLSACDSRELSFGSAVNSGEGSLVLSGTIQGKSCVFMFKNGHLFRINAGIERAQEMGAIKKLVSLTDDACAVITEKNGIYLMPLNGDFSTLTHIPVEEDALVDNKIRTVYYYEFNDIRRLYVLYDTRKGSGATEITLGQGWTVSSYKHLNRYSSDLGSDNITQVEIDALGNVWFNYYYKEKRGVSRMSPEGEFSSFDRNNSEIPNKFVNVIRAEKPDMGVKGDNVWFASRSGLTRLQYRPEKKDEEDREMWRFYGERETAGTTVARALGVHRFFSDAVLDLVDLTISEKYVIMANPLAVYTFTGKSTNRFSPGNTGGITDTRIYDISYKNGHVIVKTRPGETTAYSTKSLMLLELKSRKWFEINVWEVTRDYPAKIYLYTYNKDTDLLVLKYFSNKTVFVLLNYNTKKLKRVNLPEYKNLNDIPLWMPAGSSESEVKTNDLNDKTGKEGQEKTTKIDTSESKE